MAVRLNRLGDAEAQTTTQPQQTSAELRMNFGKFCTLTRSIVSEVDGPGQIAYFNKNAINTLKSKQDHECKITTC